MTTEQFLVYCKHRWGARKVVLLGPIVATREQAEAIVAERNTQGWDATWVGLNDQSTWIVT